MIDFSNMTTLDWVAQILGAVAYIFSCLGYLVKKKKNLLIFQVLSNLSFGTQYVFLSTVPAACNNAVNIAKYLIFYAYERKGKKYPVWSGIIFSAVSILFCILTWTDIWTLVPIITCVIFTYALMQKNELVMKIIFVFFTLAWLFFNLHVKAYFCGLLGVVETGSAVYSLIKYITRKRKPDEV